MVVRGKKKYATGEGSQYLSRRAAMNKLQITLKDFRKLCILKGIYPREPRNRKRAQKGTPGIKTLYLKKDIQFLALEPIIGKIREFKVYCKKVGTAKGLKDYKAVKSYIHNHPEMKIDHIVKERYPTFIDAIRDLDDCLTLLFLFGTFPAKRGLPPGQAELCRRLTVEFMHAVIAGRSLRKVFVSIKGYYFQAEIKGQAVTWIVPHYFSFDQPSNNEVDFKIMSLFVEFYTIMLGFTNFRLYNTLNLYYPPTFPGYSNSAEVKDLVDEKAFISERVAALNIPLSRTKADIAEEEEEAEYDHFQMTDDPDKQEEIKIEMDKTRSLKNLFKGLKFFLNREVPREPLVFVIRCFGGEVSWDRDQFVGATFNESDQSITHQIVDRQSVDHQYMSRFYVQPQWVFDSVNNRELLQVQKYFMGAVLPPHLSPFTNIYQENRYVPPEAKPGPSGVAPVAEAEEEESESEKEEESEEEEMSAEEEGPKEDEEEEEELNEEEKLRKKMKAKMSVSAGTVIPVDPNEGSKLARQEYKLREKMVKSKHRNLYKSMMQGRDKRNKEKWLLGKKRRTHNTAEKEKKKADKRSKALAACE